MLIPEPKIKWHLLVALLVFSLVGTARGAVPTFADNHVSGSSTQGNAVNSYTLRLPNLTQGGNCIIVAFQYSATGGVSASLSDDRGNSYTAPVSNNDGRQVVNLAFAQNVAAGTQKITITFAGGTPAFVTGMASEFYNVSPAGALDGSASNSGTGTSVSAGSVAPTANGDLIYQYAVQDSTSGSMISWTQGSSPWNLLSADVLDGTVAQYQVQASAAPINPTITMAPSQNYNSVAIALKSATAGNAPPPGIRVVRAQHNSIPANASSPVKLQFPCTGNLIIVAWIGVPGHDLTTITDGNSNTYIPTGAAFGFGLSGDNQIFYAASASTSTTMNGPNLSTTGNDISGSTAVLLDVEGAAVSPFDSVAGRTTASGIQSNSGSVSAVSITPSTSNGLVITSIGVDSNTIVGVTPGNFLSTVPNPVMSPNPVDQNNGWGLNYNANTGTESYVWTTQGGGVNDWASIAAAFEASNGTGSSGSFSGTVSPASATISVGDSRTFTIQISSVNSFQGQVSLSCPNAPAGISCQFTPTPVQVSVNTAAMSSLTIGVTSKPAAATPEPTAFRPRLILPSITSRRMWECFAGFVFFLLSQYRSRQKFSFSYAGATAVAALFLVAPAVTSCSGGGNTTGTGGGGSPVTVQVIIQGTSGSTTAILGTVAVTIP